MQLNYFPEDVQARIYDSKPGLTGIGSVVFRDEEEVMSRSGKDKSRCYREDIMPVKGAMELWYLQYKSLWVDLKIVFLTAVVILIPSIKLPSAWFKDLPENK